ncbi:MAG: hypothetical protein K0S80_2591, partial [Neobacillus sp.]|nr:hypothetical protein [Neobacillus sp.]MDF2789493.1 hypothetical protein [Neobacillus sp.]
SKKVDLAHLLRWLVSIEETNIFC